MRASSLEPLNRGRRFLGLLLAGALVGAACGGSEVEFATRAASDDGSITAAQETVPSQQGGLLPTGDSPEVETGANVAPPSGDNAGGNTPTTAGRSGQRGGDEGGEAAASGEPIKLGTVLPLQGGERDFGEPILRTTQAFIDELNARGGVNGRPLELIAYNACLLCEDEALTAAKRLVEEDGVFALVNTYVMVVAFQPVIPYLVEQNVPLIQGGSFSQTSDALAPINFATAPSGLFYGRWLSVTAKETAGITRVGIALLDVPSETNGLPLLRRELARVGIEIVGEARVDAAEEAVTNMDSIVTQFRAAGADGVIALDPAVLIFGRLAAKRQNWDVPWVGPAAWSILVETGCGRTCDGNVYTETGGLSFTDRDSPQMRQFLDTMNRRYPGGQVTGHTLAAWVGMQLLVEGIVRSGGDDATAFIQAIEGIENLDLGTTGPLTFSPDKHLGGSVTVLIGLEDGKFKRLSEPHSYGLAEP